MKKVFTLFALAMGLAIVSLNPMKAQSVSINTDGTIAHASAILDIKSINKGMLTPRMTTIQRTAIATPATAAGLLVYDTDTNSFWFYNGTAWSNLSSSGTPGWLLTGNSGSNPATNFIGTTDNTHLRFKINNTNAGYLTNDGNIFWGLRSGNGNTSGFSNIAIGTDALKLNTSRSNLVAIGDSALFNNGTDVPTGLEASFNTAVGSKALYSNSTGYQNIAIGPRTLFSNSKGNLNTANGYRALFSNTTASRNTAIGAFTLYNQSFSNGGAEWESDNVAVGYEALFLNNPVISTAEGVSNTAVGNYALRSNTTGRQNTSIGKGALFTNASGSYNTANGVDALYSNTEGYFNTAYGVDALYSNTSGWYNTAIGQGALNSNTIGDNNTANGALALYRNKTAGQNTAIGRNALLSQSFDNSNNAWVSSNVAVGYEALYSNQPTSTSNGVSNTAVGHSALRANTIGWDNTAVGTAALYTNNIGFQNTAIGRQALFYNTSGSQNVATGYKALRENTTGYYNTATGNYALYNNKSASFNTAIGYEALYNQSYNNNGDNWNSYNVAVGYKALYSNNSSLATDGINNTAVGTGTLFFNTTGLGNTAIGTFALDNNTTGHGNSALGYESGPNSTNLSNTTCIGNGATATANNQMVLGNANVTEFYCYAAFVGTTLNGANLYVQDNGKIGRSSSSRRYKKDIVPIDINTTNIYKLNPVSFNSYTDDSRHFGLIAEEVAEIIPELAMFSKEKDVVKGSSSEKMIPDAVQYPLLSVLILKEVQKHEQTIIEQKKTIDLLLKRIEALEKSNSLNK